MRILIDLTSLADNFSGIERYAACIARDMLKEKSNEYILVFKKEIHPMFTGLCDGKRVEAIVISPCKKLIFNQIKLPLEIYKHKADCYLFMAFPVPVLLFKKNMVTTIHDICCWDCPETMNTLSKWYFRISHRISLLKCRRVMTISDFSKQRIMNRLNYSAEKIWLIYCGVDEKFLDYEIDVNQSRLISQKYRLPNRYILSLSTLEPRKNLSLLVRAYRELVLEKKTDIPLVLAGRKGWKIDKLLDGIEEEVQNKILFTGFIDDEDLPAVYGNATVFVFPSMYEGFGIPPLEAMSCNVPVLSSDSSSLPEVLGSAAVYFKNNSREELKYKLINMLEMSAEERDKRVSLGFENIKKFDWALQAKRLVSFIENL